MIKYLYSFLFIAFLASCSATRKAQKPIVADNTKEENPVAEMETMSTVLSKLNHIEYTTFSGKTDVDFTDAKGKKNSLDAKILIDKNNLIWISTTGPLGIEVARAMITKDSVKILNKLQREYITASIGYLQDQLGLPLDLATLQDLLVGNPVFLDKFSSSYTKKDNNLLISSQTRFFKNLITVLMPGYLMSHSLLTDVDASRNRTAALSYDGYKTAGSFSFPVQRNIVVDHKGKTQINLNYKSFNFNESLSTPFAVPSGYKRIIK